MAISTAVDVSAVARVIGIKTTFKDLRAGNVLYLPQRVAVIGQGASAASYTTDKQSYTTAQAVGEAYGFGSPLHLAAKQLFPVNGDGASSVPVTFYPLEDAGSSVAAAGSITPSGAATGSAAFVVIVNGIRSAQFAVANGDTVADIADAITAAVASTPDLPVLATDNTTDVGLTAKWAGTSGNDLFIEVVSTSANNSGVSFAITQPAGGLINPDVTAALTAFGTVWETQVVNCLEIADTTALDAIQNAGEGRWGALVRKPFVAFTGAVEATVSAATTISDARKTDRINAQVPVPGSVNLPLQIAARAVARIAVLANNNPAVDYARQTLTGITPGSDSVQWAFPDRDSAVKKGSSTVEVADGVPELSDIVTFYHPDGDAVPPYRYVVDIVKLQNVLFNLDLIFAADGWAGAPLIPDDQPTANRAAKKPKMAVAAMAAMTDSLALEAIISEPEYTKANIQAAISDQNPKRLDAVYTIKLSGNLGIISVDLNFGFYFGVAPIAA